MLLVLVLAIFILTTSPASLPSVVLVAPFILSFVIMYLLIDFMFKRLGKGAGRGASLLLAGLVVILLALQSLGQLTFRDTVMVGLLFGVAFLYIRRKSRSAGLGSSS